MVSHFSFCVGPTLAAASLGLIAPPLAPTREELLGALGVQVGLLEGELAAKWTAAEWTVDD